MAGKKWRLKAILAKVEDTYGVDAEPAGATDAILSVNAEIRPMEGSSVERAVDQPYKGARPEILVNTHVGLNYGVEIAGSGTAGTAPAWASLMRACGFAETVTEATDVQYDPVSTGEESATQYFQLEGVKHALLGSRGSFDINLAVGELPLFNFQFLGLFQSVTATALPTVTLTGFKTPRPVTNADTPTFQLNGVDLVMRSLRINVDNQIAGRFLVNQEEIVSPDRAVTGTVVYEMPALGTLNPFALAEARTLVALSCVHGTTAGNIVEISGAKAELGRPTYTQQQGITEVSQPFRLLPTTGDDEIAIIVQ
jgi:hypothetical protein